MATTETELKALMVAGLGGDVTAHRALLDQLSRHWGLPNGRLSRAGWAARTRRT
jgi:hypothetical protein